MPLIQPTNVLPELEGRWLEEINMTTSNSTESGEPILQDSAILRDMGIVYGSSLVFIFLLFCWVRKVFPRPYTVRKWTDNDDLKNPLAQDQFGFFSWIWKLFQFNDDEIAEHCGLDALCFLRTLAMGRKICLVGMLNALWLIPVYATAESSKETDQITDWVVRITVSHVPPGSARLVATVLASYVAFGYTMYLILREFEWFIGMRHKFLRKPRPCNYTVYVSNIPHEIRSDHKLEEFFRHCFNGDPVVDARVRLIANKLSSLVTKRENVILKLENALAVEDVTGNAPTRNTGLVGGIPGVGNAVGAIPVLGDAMTGERVNTIELFSRELAKLNQEISYGIMIIEKMLAENAAAEASEELYQSSDRFREYSNSGHVTESDELLARPEEAAVGHSSETLFYSNEEKEVSALRGVSGHPDWLSRREEPEDGLYSQKKTESSSLHGVSGHCVPTDSFKGAKLLASGVSKKATNAVGSVIHNAKGASKLATHAVGSAVKLVAGGKDFDYYSGGFVSFRTLSLKYAALQMLHHGTPSMMTVHEAPDPQDVFWFNVGREYQELQLGRLLSRAASVAICFLWTIPMTVIASLSTVEGLKRQFNVVEDAIETFPALEPILQQLAPLLIVLSNVILRQILRALSMWEGPVSGSVVEALTFVKLATFMIVQTFFVTAISGSMLEEIKGIVEDPLSAVDLLARTLPAQSTFFIQLAFVGTVTNLAFENIRIIPLMQAYLRKFVGPRLTEKQRQKPFFGLRPLAAPPYFQFSLNMAQFSILYFMIVMVYQTIAPLTCCFLCFCFIVLRPAFLHQFVYIYPTLPDSGGKIWISFIRIIMVCMTVAQVTLVGLMALKKAGIATPLMAPLIIITILFNAYLRQEHFRVAEYLPTKECLKVDIRNGDDFSVALVKGAYLQKELREKELFPENIDERRMISLGLKNEVDSSTQKNFDTKIEGPHICKDFLRSYLLRGGLFSMASVELISAKSGVQGRWLEHLDTMTNLGNETNATNFRDSSILRDMALVYGSLLFVAFFLFCLARIVFPRPYSVRRWTNDESLKNTFADDQFGYFSWIWKLFTFSDDEIADSCGLDALCFLRTLWMGKKICLVGMLNSLWLIPLYATAESSPETDKITDWAFIITVSHVPPGSARLVATVLSAYICFGYTMYLIVQDFEWFKGMRHKFLRKPRPCNYTVYVNSIPSEIRSNQKLAEFFRQCFSGDPVVEAQVRLIANKLSDLVSKRENAVAALENALAIENLTGSAPTHQSHLVGNIPGVGRVVGAIPVFGDAIVGEKVNTVEALSHEVACLNAEISNQISVMENILSGNGSTEELVDLSTSARTVREQSCATESDKLLSQRDVRSYSDTNRGEDILSHASDHSYPDEPERAKSLLSIVSNQANSAVGTAMETAQGASKFGSHALRSAGNVVGVVDAGRDGDYYNGGFVSFRTLSLKYAALQMLHHDVPFVMSVLDAPDPPDVFWANVGRKHEDLELGRLLSRTASVAICLLWTIPIAFIASLSTVESLKRQFEFVADAVETFPALEPILEQLAPLLIILSNVILRQILRALSMWEGPVSGSIVEALTFTKLAAFLVIQTFFVSAISGSLLKEIKKIVEDPLSAIDLLANSLSAQSTFFIQLAFVSTVTGLVFENIRIIPLVQAFLRKFVGPRLTEKQRQKSFFGLRPLANPGQFFYALNVAQFSVLNIMIVLVYQTIAPLTCFFLCFCFILLRIAFLHQFVYIYPSLPDSIGKIWIRFIRIIMICMIVAQLTLVGLMGLKKADVATPLMAPLIIITILFNAYLRQEHFRVAEYLPTKECLKVDLQNGDDFAVALVKGAYLQNELREKELFPENIDDRRLISLGLKNESSTNLII